MENLNIPDFLKEKVTQEVVSTDRHVDALKDIVAGMDEEDAFDFCKFLAKKYPLIMLEAVSNRLNELIGINNSIKNIVEHMTEV